MCLITFQWQPDCEHKLILTANRDEFLHRPALELHPWPESDGIYAGKDLTQGGTWLGAHQNGRIAFLTNHRDMTPDGQKRQPKNPISRGQLVLQFLTSNLSAKEYLQQLEDSAHCYDGYNIVVAAGNHLGYYSNRSEQPAKLLEPGLYGLSNALLNTPWPKLKTATNKLSSWINTEQNQRSPLATLLSSTKVAPDEKLPDTGIGPAMERILSCEKIITPNYGTRCSTGMVWHQNQLEFEEISWHAHGSERSRQRYVIEEFGKE